LLFKSVGCYRLFFYGNLGRDKPGRHPKVPGGVRRMVGLAAEEEFPIKGAGGVVLIKPGRRACKERGGRSATGNMGVLKTECSLEGESRRLGSGG